MVWRCAPLARESITISNVPNYDADIVAIRTAQHGACALLCCACACTLTHSHTQTHHICRKKDQNRGPISKHTHEHSYIHLVFNKSAKNIHWKMTTSSINGAKKAEYEIRSIFLTLQKNLFKTDQRSSHQIRSFETARDKHLNM